VPSASPPEPAKPGPTEPGPGEPDPGQPDTSEASAPLRVSTLELFFDLVFAFTLTQLTALLADRLSLAGDAMFRRALGFGARGIGPAWPRWVTAGFALATTALGALVSIEAQLALLLAGMVAMLAVERHGHAGGPRDTRG
jgi:hypothetical protein